MLDEGWKGINENEKTVGRAEERGSVVVQFEKKGEEKERTREGGRRGGEA